MARRIGVGDLLPDIVVELRPYYRHGMRRPRWRLRVLRGGEVIYRLDGYPRGEAAGLFWLYAQRLLGEYAVVENRLLRPRGWRERLPYTVVRFTGMDHVLPRIYFYYIVAAHGLRSMKRIDRLARCMARIDNLSPIIDPLDELFELLPLDRFKHVVRGVCGAVA